MAAQSRVSGRSVASLCGLALLLSACTEPLRGAAAGAREQGIYYGEPENEYEGVVMLTIFFEDLGGAMCSGTLVAPRVVTTAKHCVVDEATGIVLDPSAIMVHTGPTGGLADYTVADIRTTSGRQVQGRDFAVVILDEVLDAEPYPYVTDWSPQRGQPITLVGYGQRDDSPEGGRKYLGDNELDRAFSNYFTTTGEPACHGDSGGPAFDADGVLVGVIVNTLGGWDGGDSCASGISGVTRVDAYHDIVDQAVQDAWVCDHEDRETCGDDRDNDCDHVVDNGCLELGDACTEGVYCASADCRDLGAGLVCTSSCTVGTADECPAGFYCDEVACGEGACLVGEAGELPLGASCGDDTECRSLSCVDGGDGGRCLRRCGGDEDCADGETCVGPGDDACGGCAPAGAGAPFSAPCQADADCAGGACREDAFGAVCTTSCTDACPEGFTCGVDGTCGRAAPAGGIGAPCAAPADCLSALCGDFAEGTACTAECDPSTPCPVGTACDDRRLCAPIGAIVGQGCGGDEDCVSGLCGNFETFRACTEPCGEAAPCPTGLVCQTGGEDQGYCRPLEPPPPAKDEGGCGCRISGGTASGRPGAAWIVLALATALMTRRSHLGRAPRKRRES